MADLPVASIAKQVIRYLSDRNQSLPGGWVSVADVRAALGSDLESIRAASLALHQRGLAELMGGFPIRPSTDRFTLVRLSDEGLRAATDPLRIDALLGSS